MKRFSIAVVIALACMMLLGSVGCSSVPERANTGEYNIGDAVITDTVENIKVDWSSGKVNFVTGSKNEISLAAVMPDNIPEEEQLHWRLDGTTLYIWDRAPELHPRIFNFSCGSRPDEKKELTLTVPEMLIFNEVNIGVSSAEVNAPVIKAVNVTVNSSSGIQNIGGICDKILLGSSSGKINAVCAADEIRANASSGDINLKSTGKADTIVLGSSSGAISVEAEKTGLLKATASSGAINAAAAADKVNLGASSGKITYNSLSQPSECNISASSGDVTLYLPEDTGFTADIDHSSGKFACDFSVVMEGDSRFVCGDGSAKIDIETSSGDINIRSFSNANAD